jgi:hypothetical protein
MSTLAVFVALAGLAAAQAPAYQGQVLLQPGSVSSKCLQADNRDGAPVVVSDCVGGDAQKWTFAGGNVEIYGNKCLEVKDGSNTDGAKLQIGTCGSNSNQGWYYTTDYHLAWSGKGKFILQRTSTWYRVLIGLFRQVCRSYERQL